MKAEKKPLENDKHEDFCNEFVIDSKRQDAYLRVYGPRSLFAKKTNMCALANQIMKLPEVQARILYLKRQRFKKKKLNVDYVLEKWMAIIEDETTMKSIRLKAINSLAEYLGALKSKVDVIHSGEINSNINVNINWKERDEKSKEEK